MKQGQKGVNVITHALEVRLDHPAVYQIEVQGRLSDKWSDWLENLEVTVYRCEKGPTISVLIGKLADQATLFGVLNRIRDMSLPLISVQMVTQIEVKEELK